MTTLAIDPATLSGWALATNSFGKHGPDYGSRLKYSGDLEIKGQNVAYGTFKASVITKTKKRSAEPAHYRAHHMYSFVLDMIDIFKVDTVICESAAAFMKGKAAIKVSHQLRAAIEIAVVEASTATNYRKYRGQIDLIYMDPPDLKFFALNKRMGSKEEMIAEALNRYDYAGDEDNEADALHLMGWALA